MRAIPQMRWLVFGLEPGRAEMRLLRRAHCNYGTSVESPWAFLTILPVLWAVSQYATGSFHEIPPIAVALVRDASRNDKAYEDICLRHDAS